MNFSSSNLQQQEKLMEFTSTIWNTKLDFNGRIEDTMRRYRSG